MNQYRKSPRAKFLDYDTGVFFITICTKDKLHSFGEIYDGEMHLTELGAYLDSSLNDANKYNKNILILSHVVMPNHVHAIISVGGAMPIDSRYGRIIPMREDEKCYNLRNPNPSLRPNIESDQHIPVLGRYINSLKGAITKFAQKHQIEFEWQTRYHDHLIRGLMDYNNISKYIENNVISWDSDCFY